ncbi:unnamed protein product [Acanthosepion pharaonis]|uniref:Uncharacterized protein n=1 Tax=Acanthosepion pharaonis TaxID=158019 RepID=A0A812BS27_ACAPH|nr:unnamed protein product [Sepia pharaonis]
MNFSFSSFSRYSFFSFSSSLFFVSSLFLLLSSFSLLGITAHARKHIVLFFLFTFSLSLSLSLSLTHTENNECFFPSVYSPLYELSFSFPPFLTPPACPLYIIPWYDSTPAVIFSLTLRDKDGLLSASLRSFLSLPYPSLISTTSFIQLQYRSFSLTHFNHLSVTPSLEHSLNDRLTFSFSSYLPPAFFFIKLLYFIFFVFQPFLLLSLTRHLFLHFLFSLSLSLSLSLSFLISIFSLSPLGLTFILISLYGVPPSVLSFIYSSLPFFANCLPARASFHSSPAVSFPTLLNSHSPLSFTDRLLFLPYTQNYPFSV